MTDQPPRDLVLVKLEEIRKEQEAMRAELLKRMDALEQKLEQKMDKLDHEVGNVALTLVGVERDMRRLTGSFGTLGAAVDEIEAGLP